MSLAISVNNVSKRYRLGEINRGQLLADLHRWWMRRRLSRLDARNGRVDTEPKEEGDFWALKNVSFDIEQGKTIGVIGSNGAGKSTLLKIISRITAPTGGLVKVYGRVGSLLEVGTGFHPDLTGRDNVFLNGAILGMSRAEVKAKFDDIVEFSELKEFIDTPVKRYSSGMYVRLAFAVSALLEPEVLIIDEVLAVGDMAFKTKCYKRLEQLISGGHTILFVAHDAGVITKFCSSAVWLDKGLIKAYGPAETVADDYRNALAPDEPEATQAVYRHGGTGEFFVTSIDLIDHDGRVTQSLACGERCSMRLNCERRFERTTEIKSTDAKLVFYDEYGRRVCALSSIHGKPLSKLSDKTGIICEFPKLPLLPGRYRVNYQLNVNESSVDAQVAARNLEVVEGNFYGTLSLPSRSTTPLCVDCIWRTDSPANSPTDAHQEHAQSSCSATIDE
jgi:lipopolysaccharide transport system ATP-binding protein